MDKQKTLVDTLLEKLQQAGIRHVFGIPGDYVLGLFDAFTHSSINMINTCDEQGAGFAADAYARINGLGVVCVTYGVGGLKLINSTAQAYAERSPVVVISGAPGIAERAGDALLHHRVKGFDTQLRVFEEVTAATAVLDNPVSAEREIERVLAIAQRSQRPVYIEIPRDCVAMPVASPASSSISTLPVDAATLKEAVRETVSMLNKAKNPVILAGVEIHRFGLQDALIDLITKTNIPFATTLMGKSVIAETRAGFLGVYGGGMCREDVRVAVEESDCLLLLGAMLTDLNTGIFTARLNPSKTISSTAETLTVRRHQYPAVDLKTFLPALLKASLKPKARSRKSSSKIHSPKKFNPLKSKSVTVARLFECLNSYLDEHTTVIADPGDALFGAADLVIHKRTKFLATAYYASLGFAVPASIGAQLADDDKRPLVLVGDGAFQMTGMELASAARYGLTPIVVVLDNKGYGTERPMLDGPFNDVHPWQFANIPDVLSAGKGYEVNTEKQLQKALSAAFADKHQLAIIHAHLAIDDSSPALKRLTKRLGERV